MGEGCGSSVPQRQFDAHTPNLNYMLSTPYMGQQNTTPLLMNSMTDMISRDGTLRGYQFPPPPNLQLGQTNEPHGWFYCLPRFRRAFAPVLNPALNDKLPISPSEIHKEAIASKGESVYAQKRFLVFDRSGDQTTLVFSSGIGTPVQCFTSSSLKPTGGYNFNRESLGTKENLNHHLEPITAIDFGANNGADLQCEMHEDTEELNALLYSDDESDYTEDDEVTSTGHSPSTMTVHDKQGLFDGSIEEIASSDGSTKKRKLFEGGCSVAPSLMDTASSVKLTRGFVCEDDAESRCANGMNPVAGEMGSEPDNKRIRRERIRETVNILENIIPGGKGKDAIVVLDEAIHYLKSLRVKAKALGLDAP